MAAELEDIPNHRTQGKSNGWNWEGADADYRKAFAAYGVDVMALRPTEAAAIVSGSAIRDQLLAALDDWGRNNQEPDGSLRTQVFTIAQLADPDEERRLLRSAVLANNAEELERLAARRKPPIRHRMSPCYWRPG